MTKPDFAHFRPETRGGIEEDGRQVLTVLRSGTQTVNVVLVGFTDGVELEVWADGVLRRRSRYLRDTEARKHCERLATRLTRRGYTRDAGR